MSLVVRNFFSSRLLPELLASILISAIPIVYFTWLNQDKKLIIDFAENFILNNRVILYFLGGLFLFYAFAKVRHFFRGPVMRFLYDAFKLVGEVIVSVYRISGGALIGMTIVWPFIEPDTINLERVALISIAALGCVFAAAILASNQDRINKKFDNANRSREETPSFNI